MEKEQLVALREQAEVLKEICIRENDRFIAYLQSKIDEFEDTPATDRKGDY